MTLLILGAQTALASLLLSILALPSSRPAAPTNPLPRPSPTVAAESRMT
jgi:hypothetical protein